VVGAGSSLRPSASGIEYRCLTGRPACSVPVPSPWSRTKITSARCPRSDVVRGGIEPPAFRFSGGNSHSHYCRQQACATPLTCEERPWKGPDGAVRVCMVGPFWTAGGTKWDQRSPKITSCSMNRTRWRASNARCRQASFWAIHRSSDSTSSRLAIGKGVLPPVIALSPWSAASVISMRSASCVLWTSRS
jgi:hypothetical protein